MKAICAICEKEFSIWFDGSPSPYCSIACQIKDGIYKDDIDYWYTKLVQSLDCGDNSCYWKKSGGMRTNGGCSCFRGMSTRHQVRNVESLMRVLRDKYEKE